MQHIGKHFICSVSKILLTGLIVIGSAEILSAQIEVGLWNRFEAAVTNTRSYSDPYNDVDLNVTYSRPNGTTVNFGGFYDGGQTWRIRFMPDQLGTWQYSASFSDGRPGISGTFECIASNTPGMISKDEVNPRWFGFKAPVGQPGTGKHVMIRSLHVSQNLVSASFPQSSRNRFLDWFQEQGYNMVSVQFYQNRELWPANASEYRRLETIFDDLARRRILVYPFYGFVHGKSAQYPSPSAQPRYFRYILARWGAYWNHLWNVSGPEPNLSSFLSSADVNRIGNEVKRQDVFGHLLGVHNKDGDDPYRNSSWSSYVTLQAEENTIAGTSALLLRNHTGTKPVYGQEDCWPGDPNNMDRVGGCTNTRLRQEVWVHMISAVAFNNADVRNSLYDAAGLTGSLDPTKAIQARHDIPKAIWDFMESVPFYRMRPRQDLVSGGFALAESGQHYLVYLPSGGSVNVNVGTGTSYQVTWVNARNTAEKRAGGVTVNGRDLRAPDSNEWVLQLVKQDGGSPTPTPTPSPTPTPTPGIVVINEDFNLDASLNNINVLRGGTWRVSGNQLRLTNPAPVAANQDNGNLAIYNAASVSGNFVLTTQASVVATSSQWDDFSIAFNVQDVNNYYYANFSESNNAETSGVFSVTNGVVIQLSDITESVGAGQTYGVKVERAGSQIRVFLNEQLVATASDGTLEGGYVGFGSKNDAANFKNLRVIR